MTEENEPRALNPWIVLGAGLVAAGIAATVAVMLWQKQPGQKARRLIAKSERLIGEIGAALEKLGKQAASQADGQ